MKNPVLGTMIDEWRQLDAKKLEKMNGLRKAVKILAFERKSRADPNSMYDSFQPFEVPTLDELVEGEMRIYINWRVEDEEEKEKKRKENWNGARGKLQEY